VNGAANHERAGRHCTILSFLSRVVGSIPSASGPDCFSSRVSGRGVVRVGDEVLAACPGLSALSSLKTSRRDGARKRMLSGA
jgi:hypothetical protein